MKQNKTIGMICVKDTYGIQYNLAKVEYENEEYEYIFTPNYTVIKLLDSDTFQGIPGLDLSLRKEC